MNDYARSMPHLGFDPAPGDIALTTSLARRHSEIVQELQQVLAVVQGIDLSGWQGEAADATRTLVGTFAPALQQTISAVQQLQAASGSWTRQLSGFQAEADALERKAASASASPGKQRPAPPGLPPPQGGADSTSGTLSGVKSQAQDLHERYLAAAGATASDVDEDPGLWERSEPIRQILETILAPLDIVAADHWIDWLKEAAGVPSEWLTDVDESIEVIESLRKEGKPASDALIDAAKLLERIGPQIDAWDTWAPAWLKAAAGSISEIRGLSYGLGALGILADAGTIISPQDSGVLGWVDRGAAGVNGALLTVNMFTDEIPVVGEVVLIGTGLYLAGDFLYHHWTPFRNVCNEIGHATAEGADWVGHESKHVWHSVTSTIGSWF